MKTSCLDGSANCYHSLQLIIHLYYNVFSYIDAVLEDLRFLGMRSGRLGYLSLALRMVEVERFRVLFLLVGPY